MLLTHLLLCLSSLTSSIVPSAIRHLDSFLIRPTSPQLPLPHSVTSSLVPPCHLAALSHFPLSLLSSSHSVTSSLVLLRPLLLRPSKTCILVTPLNPCALSYLLFSLWLHPLPKTCIVVSSTTSQHCRLVNTPRTNKTASEPVRSKVKDAH